MAKRFGKYFVRFAGINLAAFLIYYISGYVLMNEAVEYVRYFLSEAIDFALPVVTAALLAIAFAECGFRFVWLSIATALARLLYLVPSAYLQFIESQTMASDEAILLALPISFAIAAIELLVVMLLVFIIYMVTDRLAKKRGISYADATGEGHSAFDFSSPLSVAVFSVSATVFVVKLVLEIVDVVEFLSNYADSYQVGEVIYIAIKFIFLLAELLLTQALVFKIKSIKDDKESANADL